MQKMIFACSAVRKKDVVQALLLTESIRTFAGEFSNLPFLLMVPDGDSLLTRKQLATVEKLAVDLHYFDIDPQAAKFPFAGKVIAAGTAESIALEKTSQLVWMDNGALVVNPVDLLVLEHGIQLGYRPVDHLLVGSPYDQPVDPFWQFVYQSCGVTEENIFPMVTSTDQVKMRPYFNAGMLVIRPEERLLQRWSYTFLEVYQDSILLDFYEKDRLYRIFIHQAILAGCVLARFRQAETLELPPQVNYPLHMHAQYPTQLQPSTLNELVSFRYERFFTKPGWRDILQVDPPLNDWLDEREKQLAPR